ncbi:MAG: hypothetical protein ABIW50_05495, partial [Candidatus Limnocylindria bacterium]
MRFVRLAMVPALALVLLASGCGLADTNATPRTTSEAAPPRTSVAASPSVAALPGAEVPAPGSDSAVYEPNPGAIVVAIDAGHGGCLDWGVPDPSERGV